MRGRTESMENKRLSSLGNCKRERERETERAIGLLCMRVLISSALNKDSLNGRISNARRGPVPELYSIILFLLLPSSFHFFMMDR